MYYKNIYGLFGGVVVALKNRSEYWTIDNVY